MDMLKKLAEERESAEAFITKLTDGALGENRDMSDNELELIKRQQARISELDKQINVLSQETALDEQAKERLAKHTRGVVERSDKSVVEYRTAGHYLQDYIQTVIGRGDVRVDAEQRLRRYHRAAAHITTGEFAGVFPDEIVGPVVNFINASRPLASAVGMTAIPSGPSFRRPRLVDDHIADGVGVQAAQKDELVSQPFRLESDSVDLSTLGGYLNVARQVLDWGVASMDTIVNQLAARYAYATERALLTEIEKSTGKETLAAGADSAAIIEAFYNAAAKLYAETNMLPSILAAGPLGWARLGSATDTAGRQIFPFLAPANAGGTQSADSFAANPVGLRLVVTPAMTDDSFWVLNAASIEGYETIVGSLSVSEPSVMGIQVAYGGYVGFYRPAPNGAIHVAP